MTLRGLASRHAGYIEGATQGGLAEPVTYRFKSGDPDRELTAVVKRLDLEPASFRSPQVARRRAHVEVWRDATNGVLAVAAGDSIVLPMRVGDDPKDCRIGRIVSQDDALFVVEVEA